MRPVLFCTGLVTLRERTNGACTGFRGVRADEIADLTKFRTVAIGVGTLSFGLELVDVMVDINISPRAEERKVCFLVILGKKMELVGV